MAAVLQITSPFYHFGEPNRDHHLKLLVAILSVVTEMCLPNHWLAMDTFLAICCGINVITKLLLTTGGPLCLYYSGFQAVLIEPLPSNHHICHSILRHSFSTTWCPPEHVPQIVPGIVWSFCKLCLCASTIFSGIQ
jgi:hypothetical protein